MRIFRTKPESHENDQTGARHRASSNRLLLAIIAAFAAVMMVTAGISYAATRDGSSDPAPKRDTAAAAQPKPAAPAPAPKPVEKPKVAEKPKPKPKPAPKPVHKTKPSVKAKPAPKVKAAAKPKPKVHVKPKPKATVKAHTAPKPKVTVHVKPKPKPAPKVQAKPKATKPAPKPKAVAVKPAPKPAAKPTPKKTTSKATPTGASFSGMASFYGGGDGFDGKTTASGQTFNSSAMTAAHRTLPFGTKLQVTYQGKSVIVTVTDRGPYVGGRVLDLSAGAARAIGLASAGVGFITATPVG